MSEESYVSFDRSSESFPNAEFLSKHGFYLPSGLGITNDEIRYICKNLNSIL